MFCSSDQQAPILYYHSIAVDPFPNTLILFAAPPTRSGHGLIMGYSADPDR